MMTMMTIETKFVHVNGVTSIYSTCVRLTKRKSILFDVYRPSDACLTYLWLLHVYDWPSPNHLGFHSLSSLGEYSIDIALSYASHAAEEGSASLKPRPWNICLLHQSICRGAAFQRRMHPQSWKLESRKM